jgi:hypothetical protein
MSDDFLNISIYIVVAVVLVVSSYYAGKKAAYRETIAMVQQERSK